MKQINETQTINLNKSKLMMLDLDLDKIDRYFDIIIQQHDLSLCF